MAYKHGIYTESVSTSGKLSVKSAGTVPVYIGTAPKLVDDKLNTPILINSYSDFASKCGYEEDWESYTLCEVAYAHFKNNTQSIAPFIVIGLKATATTTAEGETTETVDFASALKAIDSATILCGVTPNIIVAPKYSATYAADIINKCTEGIAGKWACVAYIDIPTDTVTSIESALSYKSTNKITSKYARLHFPKAKYSGKVFHLSVLDAVASQIVDNETDGISCRSSSNKQIICDVPTIDGENGFIYSEADANKLNEKGITTINYIGGMYKLWGGHMANYDYPSIDSIEAKDRSDASVRMQVYLDNWLKREYIDGIDAPLTRREIDNLLSSVNIGLNSFVNSGYLLKGECYFDEGDNTLAELADGNLVLEVLHTETPNGKSISFKLQYDVSGLETLYSVEEE